MSDELLDRAIDEVARQMTEAAPPGAAAFRHRVLARIETGDAPRRFWRAVFVLSPIAAAIVIAVVAFLMRGRIQPAASVTVTQRTEQGRPLGGPSRPVGIEPAPPETASSQGPDSPAAAANAGRLLSPAGRGIAEGASVKPAPPVDSIAVTPLVVDTLTPESIAIPRLDIVAPMMVAPLDIPDAQRREP